MVYQLIFELEIGKDGDTIKVCITGILQSIDFKQDNEIISINFLAIDDKGNAIQGTIYKMQIKEFRPLLKKSCVYFISQFKIYKPK
ncbi:hypothetical protein SCA6_014311 [Theobroma cacao]